MHLGIRVSYRKERKGDPHNARGIWGMQMEEIARSLMSFKVSLIRVGAPQAPSCPKTIKTRTAALAGNTSPLYPFLLEEQPPTMSWRWLGPRRRDITYGCLVMLRHFFRQTSLHLSYPLSTIVTSLFSSLSLLLLFYVFRQANFSTYV